VSLPDSSARLAAENEHRLRELCELFRLRVLRSIREAPMGGEVHLRVRVEKGGRIGRDSRLTVEEFLQAEREGA